MHISIESDFEYVAKCVAHKDTWYQTADDAIYPYRELYFPRMDGNEFFVRIDDFGVLSFDPHNSILYECHVYLLPSARGKSVAICKEVMAWIFKETPAERIFVNVPRCNELALRLAKKTGLKECGINPNSFMKNGKLHDVVMLGISKGE